MRGLERGFERPHRSGERIGVEHFESRSHCACNRERQGSGHAKKRRQDADEKSVQGVAEFLHRLLNDLVRTQEQRLQDCEPHRSGRLEVDHEALRPVHFIVDDREPENNGRILLEWGEYISAALYAVQIATTALRENGGARNACATSR